MPSILNNLDTRFPTFMGVESTERKVNTIQDYLYQLTEELRYALHNIDTTNMNEQELDGFVQTITKPVYARIEDDEENISELAFTAQGLSTRVGNAENSITSLNVTAQGLSTSVGNLETGMSTTLHMTAGGVYITDAQGNNVSINGGQLTAGTVVADSVSASGITAGTITAAITINSPTILGGRYYNSNRGAYMQVDPASSGFADWGLYYADGTPKFRISDEGGIDSALYFVYQNSAIAVAGSGGVTFLKGFTAMKAIRLTEGENYGTLAQRNALSPTAGRLFLVRT